MSAFVNSQAEYLTPSLGEEDENDISQVNRQPLKGKHSANIKENNDEIAKLRNEISDFKELINTLANKRDGKYKCVC